MSICIKLQSLCKKITRKFYQSDNQISKDENKRSSSKADNLYYQKKHASIFGTQPQMPEHGNRKPGPHMGDTRVRTNYKREQNKPSVYSVLMDPSHTSPIYYKSDKKAHKCKKKHKDKNVLSHNWKKSNTLTAFPVTITQPESEYRQVAKGPDLLYAFFIPTSTKVENTKNLPESNERESTDSDVLRVIKHKKLTIIRPISESSSDGWSTSSSSDEFSRTSKKTIVDDYE